MKRTKYPRTFNLPWSESNSSDDVWWKDCSLFEGREVVVTEKQDGECTSVYPDGHVHARSIDSHHHPSRSWVKQLAGQIAHDIPQGCRICGENLYAYHSIFYTGLPSYFLVYGVYDGDRCLSWAETEEVCELLGLCTVPVIYKGLWDEKLIRDLWTGKGAYPTYEGRDCFGLLRPKFPDDFSPCVAEGYVVRLADSFPYSEFSKSCAKYVRAEHVKTSSHWMERAPIPNLLKVT
jgi:hypothetical protein